jgi:hypothetical protein
MSTSPAQLAVPLSYAAEGVAQEVGSAIERDAAAFDLRNVELENMMPSLPAYVHPADALVT